MSVFHSLSLSLLLMYDLVFHARHSSSCMQVSCWLFAVFCLQGARGLVGPRGPPGPPGQPVSQHRLDYKIRAIQSLQLYKSSLLGTWNHPYATENKQANYWTVSVELWQIIHCFLICFVFFCLFFQGIQGTDGAQGQKGNLVSVGTFIVKLPHPHKCHYIALMTIIQKSVRFFAWWNNFKERASCCMCAHMQCDHKK